MQKKYKISEDASKLVQQMDSEQLDELFQDIKLRRNYLAQINKRSFRVGDTVKFQGRGHQMLDGIVERIKQKYILVNIPKTGQRWNVHPNLLTKGEK
jgi:biotin-(acetyl-CoA carboxylase) ligase